MQYLIHEDVLLRARTPDADDLEIYSHPYHRWIPYVWRRRDIEFYKVVTADEARDHLEAAGASDDEAERAVKGR